MGPGGLRGVEGNFYCCHIFWFAGLESFFFTAVPNCEDSSCTGAKLSSSKLSNGANCPVLNYLVSNRLVLNYLLPNCPQC